MSDDSDQSNTKDIIDATTSLVKAIPIYEDLLQPAAQELGSTLVTLAKTVNIALSPVSLMVWSYDRIKEFVLIDLSEKLRKTPQENIVTPNPMVAGPALEALTYAGNDKTLRNMYANLIANAMDEKTKSVAHPSFVEVIKQLSPQEALILLLISQQNKFPEICVFKETIKIMGGFSGIGGGEIFSNRVTEEFTRLCLYLNIADDVDLLSVLDNFKRLQIVEINTTTNQTFVRNPHGDWSDDVVNHIELKIDREEVLHFTRLGTQFINACVRDKI
jgi:hypothetical protein